MADNNAADDPNSEEYWHKYTPQGQRGVPYTRPEDTSTPKAAPKPPEGQRFTDASPASPYLRHGAIAGQEFMVGAAGIPAWVARQGWNVDRSLYNNVWNPLFGGKEWGPVPPQLYAEGPEGYGTFIRNRLGLEPQNVGERMTAGTARGAGTMAVPALAASILPGGQPAAGQLLMRGAMVGAAEQGLAELGAPEWARNALAVASGAKYLSGMTRPRPVTRAAPAEGAAEKTARTDEGIRRGLAVGPVIDNAVEIAKDIPYIGGTLRTVGAIGKMLTFYKGRTPAAVTAPRPPMTAGNYADAAGGAISGLSIAGETPVGQVEGSPFKTMFNTGADFVRNRLFGSPQSQP